MVDFDELERQATVSLENLLKTEEVEFAHTKRLQKIMEASQATFGAPVELEFSLLDLLGVMKQHQASDLHIKAGSPPMARINGELFPIGKNRLTPIHTKYLVFSICSEKQKKQIETGKELDFAYFDGTHRYRVNVYLQKSCISAAFRLIKTRIPSISAINLPSQIVELVKFANGLILVTGPAGSGKSTTLATMVDFINKNFTRHIITIEDPIEYIHQHDKSIVTQREIGSDTEDFATALKYCLRQDPDVILIGEMRDPETIITACQAAETGHLVLSTLHTSNAVFSIKRILDIFTGENQKQLRFLLASALRGVISQRLLARPDGQGRVPAVEIMMVTPTIASLIVEDRIDEIYQYIVDGGTEGMQTLNQSLADLFGKGLITYDDAMHNSDYSTELRMMLEGSMDKIKITDTDEKQGLISWL